MTTRTAATTFAAAALACLVPLLARCTNPSSSAPGTSVGTPSPTSTAGTPSSSSGGTSSGGASSGGASSGGTPSSDASSPPGTPTQADASVPPPASDASSPPGRLVAYASGYSPAIDVFTVNETTGALTLEPDAGTTSFGSSPSFLAMNPAATTLYAVDEETSGQVGAYAVAKSTGAITFLNAVSSGGNGPPFVHVDASGKYVLVANYGDGTVSVLPVLAGGKLGAPLSTLTVGAEAHMILPDPSNHFVFVPCKGADYIAQFLFDPSSGALTPNATPRVATAAGAGPRHLAFHPNGKLAYLINETNSTMTAYAFDATAGTLTAIQTLSTIPATFTGTNTGAEVWVHPSGAWVLGSNRGDDSIVVFAIDAATGKMTFKGTTPSGGASPRDFTLDPTGKFLYAANQTGNDVVSFTFDATKGTLATVGAPFTLTAASFVGVVRLPGP